MWLFRLGQMLGLPSLILKSLSGWKIYLIIAAVAFAAGVFSCHKLYNIFDKAEQAKVVDKIFEVEEKAIELKEVREIVYKDRIKEVIKYVEVNTPTECFNDDQLLLFNARN